MGTEPLLGTPVQVQQDTDKEWYTRIYICRSDKGIICVGSNDEERFKKGLAFRTYLWNKIKE